MTVIRHGLVCVLSLFLISCQQNLDRRHSNGTQPTYVELLERIEIAGNRYRHAMDLVKYSNSSLERSLAESHVSLCREFLESEFQLAEIESKVLATQAQSNATGRAAAANSAEQSQYDSVAAEVWRLSAELEEAKQRLAAARQNMKKATTPDGFRKAQRVVDQAQNEVMIADKKLDLAGSNLDILDYKRKQGTSAASDAVPFADRLKMIHEELFPPVRTSSAATSPPKLIEPEQSYESATPPSSGIVAVVREYFSRREKFQNLGRAQEETKALSSRVQESLTSRLRELESLQAQQLELNRKTEAAYNQAYQKLQSGGNQAAVRQSLDEADQQMAASALIDQRKDLDNRAALVVRRQAIITRDDGEKLASWAAVAGEDQNDSLLRLANRVGIVLGVIALILILSYYLKKLPYQFTHEGKNLYYFRKLISFGSGLLIGAIILLNFMGDFGSLSAVIGLAGAGLAIALQDPIVSLVGWFLIVGKFGISVGDRVEINQVKGDVIDIGLLRIAVLEVGNWVGAEQSTGRAVFFPNSFIFKNHYFNYSTATPFIWDEIRITVTYESDWKRAREIIEEVALRISQTYMEEAKHGQAQVARRFHINLGKLTPYVYVSIADSGVDLLLRYLTEIRKRRITQDQICREILEAFDKEPRVGLAYPTRRNVTETRMVTANPEPVREQE